MERSPTSPPGCHRKQLSESSGLPQRLDAPDACLVREPQRLNASSPASGRWRLGGSAAVFPSSSQAVLGLFSQSRAARVGFEIAVRGGIVLTLSKRQH